MMDVPATFTPNTDERRKTGFSGFGGRKDSDSEEDEPKPMNRIPGAAIAPPPSLQESFVSSPAPQQSSSIGGGMGVAAKIMAKYGFKVSSGGVDFSMKRLLRINTHPQIFHVLT